MINKACPTPATTGTMETPRANGDAGAEQLLEAPVDEMDYINSSCCSSSWSLNITVTVLTPFRKKVLQHTTEPQVCYPAAGTVPSSGSG